MHYFFLREDFDRLNGEIAEVCDKIKETGQEMGISCKEGAETFHDNWVYEEGERRQHMLSSQLRKLIQIRNRARVVAPDEITADRVSIGTTIIVRDETTSAERTFRIGSYKTYREGDVAYNAPLARVLIGAKVGDTRQGMVGGKQATLTVLNVQCDH